MKITFTISQLGGGGAERVVALLSSKLCEMGHDVSLITLIKRPIVYSLNKNVKLINLDCRNSRVLGTISQIKHLRAVYRRLRPDVIISFLPVVNMTAIIANLGLSSKIIVSERNDPYQNPRKKIVRVMRDFWYHFSDGFVFQTSDAREYFGKHAQTGAIIANPINSNLPEPFIGERTKRFVSAVRLDKQKNLDMFLRAFAKLHMEYPDYTVEIYGEGPEKEHLEKLAEELQISNCVFLKGFSKKIYEDILDATAFVLPSNYEGLSNSMLEALALGVPVISTDHPIGGARMFIKNGNNGILTKVGDTDEMMRALLYAVNNPEKMQAMADRAVEIRKTISINNIVDKWINYIKLVCKNL